MELVMELVILHVNSNRKHGQKVTVRTVEKIRISLVPSDPPPVFSSVE